MARQIGKARRGIGARWRGTTLILGVLLAFGIAGVALGGSSDLTSGGSAPTIASDQADYNPGMTVTLNGTNWESGPNKVHIVVNDTAGIDSWIHEQDVDVVAGAITDSFPLPTYFIASYTVTATQETAAGTLTASSSFTDANPAADLDQCANGTAGPPIVNESCNEANTTNVSNWVNGNLNGSKSHFLEGDSIPYRLRMTDLAQARIQSRSPGTRFRAASMPSTTSPASTGR